jgi:hypothetical protein
MHVVHFACGIGRREEGDEVKSLLNNKRVPPRSAPPVSVLRKWRTARISAAQSRGVTNENRKRRQGQDVRAGQRNGRYTKASGRSAADVTIISLVTNPSGMGEDDDLDDAPVVCMRERSPGNFRYELDQAPEERRQKRTLAWCFILCDNSV